MNGLYASNGTASTSFTYADMIAACGRVKEIAARREAEDRKVYFYPGTLDQFRAAATGRGFELRGHRYGLARSGVDPYPLCSPVPPESLAVREFGPGLLIGTDRAIGDFLDPEKRSGVAVVPIATGRPDPVPCTPLMACV